jgi:small subunit ribosomal protein S3
MSLEKHFIQEGIIRSEVENYLRNELNRAGYSGIDIQKTPLATRVILYVEKPPLVIGKRGKRINTLTDYLKNKYHLENPTIDVQKIEDATLDPNIVARRIAVALERGINRRRVAYKALRAVMGSGARGVEIVLSGKIVGKGGRSRVEKYSEGYMKKCGESSKLVKVGSVQATLKAGVIGVTAKIVPPNTMFPDQISTIKAAPESGEKGGKAKDEESGEKKKARKPRVKKESKEQPADASAKTPKEGEGVPVTTEAAALEAVSATEVQTIQ